MVWRPVGAGYAVEDSTRLLRIVRPSTQYICTSGPCPNVRKRLSSIRMLRLYRLVRPASFLDAGADLDGRLAPHAEIAVFEPVAPDHQVADAGLLVPEPAVAFEQDRGAGRVKHVVFDHHLRPRSEQDAAGPIAANGAMVDVRFGIAPPDWRRRRPGPVSAGNGSVSTTRVYSLFSRATDFTTASP